MTNLFFSGPSGSGKSTVVSLLLKEYMIERIITTTTRNPRYNEKNGIDYNFITKEEFLKNIDNFFEFEEYIGNYYGTRKDQIYADNNCNKIGSFGKQGIISLRKNNVPGIYIFIYADKNVLKERLIKRYNKDVLEDCEIKNIEDRLQSFDEELKFWDDGYYDFKVKNNNLEETLKELRKILDDKIDKRK